MIKSTVPNETFLPVEHFFRVQMIPVFMAEIIAQRNAIPMLAIATEMVMNVA